VLWCIGGKGLKSPSAKIKKNLTIKKNYVIIYIENEKRNKNK